MRKSSQNVDVIDLCGDMVILQIIAYISSHLSHVVMNTDLNK